MASEPNTTAIGFDNAEISLYPNPFTESATIDLDRMSGMALLEVYDVTGKLIRREFLNLERGELTRGAYLLRVIQGQQQSTAPFRIE